MVEHVPAGIDSQLRFQRPVFNQENFHEVSEYEKPRVSILTRTRNRLRGIKCRPTKCIKQIFPIFDWLATYKWKTDLVCDIMAGCTVAVMHIPQGLGHAMLASVPPVVGIYMAFFPNLMYILLGSSRHNSMGTFAVVTLLVGRSVTAFSQNPNFTHSVYKDINGTTVLTQAMYTQIEVGTSLTLLVSFWQFIFYACRMGIICTLLSDALVNSFITGAAVHIFTSQIKEVVGVKPKIYTGPLNIIYTYIDIVTKLINSNDAQRTGTYATLILSAVCITVLILNAYLLKPYLDKFTKIPFPAELILVIAGVFAANGLQLYEVYHVNKIGLIPKGLPEPQLPYLNLIQELLINSFVTAVVAYAVSMSMVLILAEGENYEVDPNQEFLAHAAGNFFGSFFSCIVYSASLSRSVVLRSVGGKTQMTAFVAACIIVVVLLAIADFFTPLSKVVLASIIIFTLRKVLYQVTDLPRFWRNSTLDGITWIIVFLAVVVIDIDYGLGIGLILSIGSIFLQGLKAYTCLLGNLPNTDVYLDINRYKAAVELPGMKILHYRGALNFATRQHLKEEIIKLTGINPQKEKRRKDKREKRARKLAARQQQLQDVNAVNNVSEGVTNISFVGTHTNLSGTTINKISCLILDFSALSSIDPAGAAQVDKVTTQFRDIDIPILIAGCSGPVYEKIKKCGYLEGKFPLSLFPTIQDAVHKAQNILAMQTDQDA